MNKDIYNTYKEDCRADTDGSINPDAIDTDSRTSFTNELDELLKMDVKIELSKIMIDDFGNYEISHTDRL